MATARSHSFPSRVLLCYSGSDRHTVWTQAFKSKEGWLRPEDYDPTMEIALNPRYHGETASISITKWAFSRPIASRFVYVARLTVSNYDKFRLKDIIKMLDSMSWLEELELCKVNIVYDGTGPVVLPGHWHREGRSLKRLALEACNITEGYVVGYHHLFFRFLTLFRRIGRLRVVGTISEGADLYFPPIIDPTHLPALTHLEVEGVSTYIKGLFEAGTPVQALLSLHLSRCTRSWDRIFRLAEMVHTVSPTLRHLAFRPNLEQSSSHRQADLFREFAHAVGQCTELRELEFGLYKRCQRSVSLFRTVLAALRERSLERLTFVLDLGHSQWPDPDIDIVRWSDLDDELSRVCVDGPSKPLEIRIQRCSESTRNVMAGFYEDPWLWVQRLPRMCTRMSVVDTLHTGRLAIGHYAAPARIDEQRIARIAASGLRSLFDV